MDIWKNFTPQFFDTLVIVVIIIGLALAVVRLYADFSRKLPPEADDDTKPNLPIQREDAN